jgi:hypothetical protein
LLNHFVEVIKAVREPSLSPVPVRRFDFDQVIISIFGLRLEADRRTLLFHYFAFLPSSVHSGVVELLVYGLNLGDWDEIQSYKGASKQLPESDDAIFRTSRLFGERYHSPEGWRPPDNLKPLA